jgi:hypothetical protein
MPQSNARESGRSVFVDRELHPYRDQWACLASIEAMSPLDIEPTILRATGGAHPLDVTFIDDEVLAIPWKRATHPLGTLTDRMPELLTVTLAYRVYFE